MFYSLFHKKYPNRTFSLLVSGIFVLMLASCSDSSDAFLNKGKSLLREGKLREGIDYINKAIEKDLTNADAFNSRGVAYFELKEYLSLIHI